MCGLLEALCHPWCPGCCISCFKKEFWGEPIWGLPRAFDEVEIYGDCFEKFEVNRNDRNEIDLKPKPSCKQINKFFRFFGLVMLLQASSADQVGGFGQLGRC